MPAEKKAADEIQNRCQSIRKLARDYNFSAADKQLRALLSLVSECNSLPGANRSTDAGDEEWAYPPEYQSRYLLQGRSNETMRLINSEAADYQCECQPTDCQCSYGAHTTNHSETTSCDFCGEDIADGELLIILDKDDKKMCSICDGFFEKAVFPEFSASKAIDVLVNDAVMEASAPWYQFQKCMQFLEMAQVCCKKVIDPSPDR